MSAAAVRRPQAKRGRLADYIITAIIAAVAAVPWLAFAFGPFDPHNFFFGSDPATAHILGLPIPPSGGLTGWIGATVSLLGLLVAIVFMKSTISWPPTLVAMFALFVAAFVGEFAAIYVQLSHDAPQSCFSAPLTKLDAIYFTLGTLSTAGTGDLTVVSEPCRAMVSVQLVTGFVMVTIAVSGLVSRLMHESS
jgi:voltage-gated potassium channel